MMNVQLREGHSVSTKQWFFIVLWNVFMIISMVIDPMVSFSTQWLSAGLIALSLAHIMNVMIDTLPSTASFDISHLFISWVSAQFSILFILTFLDFFEVEGISLLLVIIASVVGTLLGTVLIITKALPSRRESQRVYATTKKWYCASCGASSSIKFRRCPECKAKAHF
jgi:hypothetical protein